MTDAKCQVPVKKVAPPTKDSTAAMAELQDDIGDVLEGERQVASQDKNNFVCLLGLTELAERFPEDFSSLMEAFEGGAEEKARSIPRHNATTKKHHLGKQRHAPMTRNIKQSEIRNLANIIAEEEEERQKMGKFPKDQKFKDLGVCQKPSSPPHGQVAR